MGGNLITKRVDLSAKEEVMVFGNFVLSLGKSISVLINNAGVFLPGNVHEEPEGQLEQIMAVNFFAPVYLIRCLAGHFKKNLQGHIFNIGSIAGKGAYPNGSSYSISKYALEGLTMNLRNELSGFGIHVTNVVPGKVLTPSWEGAGIPEEKFINPEDLANVIFDITKLSSVTNIDELVVQP